MPIRGYVVWGASDGWVLGGMWFGVGYVVWGWVVALRDWRPGAGGHAGAGGCCFASLTAGC